MSSAVETVLNHVRRYFDGHSVSLLDGAIRGPIYQRVPKFNVVVVGPGTRTPALWTFISVGCWDAVHDARGHGSEFLLVAADDSEDHITRLAMNAYYHAGPVGQRLGHGHTVPIGEGWVTGSHLDHLLLATPCPFGPELEWCRWDKGHAQLLWLMPITEAERDFKATHGLDALEQRLEDGAIHYWDPHRASVA